MGSAGGKALRDVPQADRTKDTKARIRMGLFIILIIE
jgi:hypothetical protein